MISIVGLGPAGIDIMSVSALNVIKEAANPYFRTGMHPAAQELFMQGVRFDTFDYLYEQSESFDDVYNAIATFIIEESRKSDVVYAVPGHPLCAEKAVSMIIERAKAEGIPYKIFGSESFIDACLEDLAMPLGKGLKLVDALAIDEVPPSTECPNLIYQVYDKFIASDLKLALMDRYPDEFEVYIITAAGSPDAKVEKLPLFELDRREVDHLSSVFVPELTSTD